MTDDSCTIAGYVNRRTRAEVGMYRLESTGRRGETEKGREKLGNVGQHGAWHCAAGRTSAVSLTARVRAEGGGGGDQIIAGISSAGLKRAESAKRRR